MNAAASGVCANAHPVAQRQRPQDVHDLRDHVGADDRVGGLHGGAARRQARQVVALQFGPGRCDRPL